MVSGEPKAADDASDLQWVEIDGLKNVKLAFDHYKIISDYQTWLKNNGTYWSSK